MVQFRLVSSRPLHLLVSGILQIVLHAWLSSGSNMYAYCHLDHTDTVYGATVWSGVSFKSPTSACTFILHIRTFETNSPAYTEYHHANAVVLIVLAFVHHFGVSSFLRRLFSVASMIFVLIYSKINRLNTNTSSLTLI